VARDGRLHLRRAVLQNFDSTPSHFADENPSSLRENDERATIDAMKGRLQSRDIRRALVQNGGEAVR